MGTEQPEAPPHARCREFLVAGMSPGLAILDIGCGTGDLMADLARRGCAVTGIEIDGSLVQRCQAAGLRVLEGQAEHLPVAAASLDAVVCSMVLPYTDERRAIAEWARTLKPGGVANATFHGIGYGLDYLLHGPGWKRRFYGARMLANTLFYQVFGHRLPGFLGDTLCQTSRRMRSYYRAFGLDLQRESVIGVVAGFPRFLGHRVVKRSTKRAGRKQP